MTRLILWALAFAVAADISAGAAEDVANQKIYPGPAGYNLASRNALVVGVASLKDGNGFAPLKNPGNDASRVSTALRNAGFAVMNLNEVYKPEQLTRQNIKLALYDFARILQSAGGVGLIYFSGHGVERDGQMYLAPYDAYVRFERDLNEELIPLRLFYEAIQYANNPLNLFVIDACRDNPWTKALEQFGPRHISESTPASENVVLANSTLSGKKSPDGAGDLSPYAKVFVSSLEQTDASLTDFFGSIGDALYLLRQQIPDMPVPTIQQPPGREFVFVPTLITYNREFNIYKTGRETGSRELLKQLTWKYSGGYFYKAAKNWLDSAPLAPQNPLPTVVVQLQDISELRSAPGSNSTILEKRPAGSIFVATALSRLNRYVAIQTNWRQEAAFVRSDQVRLAPVKIQQKMFNVTFKDSSEAGIELLSEESVAQIEILKKQYAPLLTRLDIVGYQYRGTDRIHRDSLRLLARQAKLIQTLADIGYDSSKVSIIMRYSNKIEDEDTIQVQINGSALPETQAFQKFDVPAFIKGQQSSVSRLVSE